MPIALLRFGFLLTTLVASLHVLAETRYWTLNGVQFEDGAVATGYFSYDDLTGSTNWNVRVSAGAGSFIPWTFVPGNSTGGVSSNRFFVGSYTEDLHPAGYWWRSLDITVVAPLDGRSASVLIDVCRDCPTGRLSSETFVDYYYPGPSRKIIAGSVMLATSPPPATVVQVDEFYHRGLRHYFITADPAEKQLLDTGVHPGWERTGESFKAYATGSRADGSMNPVCRYYGRPGRGIDSHFYSASNTSDTLECVKVFVRFSSDWQLESDNVFQINLPNTSTGACPNATVPVYRLWNQRRDSNHRYTTSAAIKAEMIASGHVAEGYGPDRVVMCAVQ